jgi:hypothetical protein
VIELAIARVRHAWLPASAILTSLQDGALDDREAASPAADVRLIAWAVATAAARVPWRADCLICAMAADRWLRRCGRRPEFILGVARTSQNLQAHAWLRCEGIAVTGGTGEGFARLVAAERG